VDYSQVAIPDDPRALGLIYVAGPMTIVGPPTWNYPAFEELASALRKEGRKVISPHELHEPSEDLAWDWFLRRDLTQLVKCSDMAMLPGWQSSRGAKLEHYVGKALGLTIHYPEERV
jgi:Domain of unknown function (DUF4406)